MDQPGRFLRRCGVLPSNDAGRNSDRNRVRRNVRYDYRVGADGDIVADCDGSQNLRTGANVHAIADGRRTTPAGMFQADSNPIADYDIVAEDGVAADYDSTKMLNLEAVADARFAGQFNARENLDERIKQLVQKGQWCADDSMPEPVPPSAEAVDDHHPQALPPRVTFMGQPIFAQIFKHGVGAIPQRAWRPQTRRGLPCAGDRSADPFDCRYQGALQSYIRCRL